MTDQQAPGPGDAEGLTVKMADIAAPSRRGQHRAGDNLIPRVVAIRGEGSSMARHASPRRASYPRAASRPAGGVNRWS